MKEETKNRIETLFEGLDDSLIKTDPEWVDIVVNFSQEEVIKENKLTYKEQMLSILSVLLGTQALGEYKNMLHAALKSRCENQLRGHTAGNIMAGNDKSKLYSIVEQCMPYIGYPRTLNAMNIIDEVADQLSK